MMSKMICKNCGEIGNPIDALFDSYFDSRGRDSDRVADAYDRVCQALAGVGSFRSEVILGAVADLCMEHERTGFEEGIQVGARLATEINK